MSVLWKITSRTEEKGVHHMEVNIDERICDITPMSKGLCGFPLYSWMQVKLTPRICNRAPRRTLSTPSRGSRGCTVQARFSDSQPIKLTGIKQPPQHYRAIPSFVLRAGYPDRVQARCLRPRDAGAPTCSHKEGPRVGPTALGPRTSAIAGSAAV